MKLAVIIGHNAEHKGAAAVAPISQFEYDYNSIVADHMAERAAQYGFTVEIFRRQPSGSYGQEIRDVYARTDAWGADQTIELHFNAFNTLVSGTETLAGPSERSAAAAFSVQKAVVALFDRGVAGDRGVKNYRPGMRGALSLIAGRAPAILVEPFFGDHAGDAAQAHGLGPAALAATYLAGIADAYGLQGGENLIAAAKTPDFTHAM